MRLDKWAFTCSSVYMYTHTQTSIPRNYIRFEADLIPQKTIQKETLESHTHSAISLYCTAEKTRERERHAGLVVIWLCVCVPWKEPDYHQSSWNSSLISAWQGPVLRTVDELTLGTGLPGDKHCCLCYALLNNSISMVLRSAMSWLAAINSLQFCCDFLWTDGRLNTSTTSLQCFL